MPHSLQPYRASRGNPSYTFPDLEDMAPSDDNAANQVETEADDRNRAVAEERDLVFDPAYSSPCSSQRTASSEGYSSSQGSSSSHESTSSHGSNLSEATIANIYDGLSSQKSNSSAPEIYNERDEHPGAAWAPSSSPTPAPEEDLTLWHKLSAPLRARVSPEKVTNIASESIDPRLDTWKLAIELGLREKVVLSVINEMKWLDGAGIAQR